MREIKYKGNYMEVSEENIDGHIYERVKLLPGVIVIPVRDGEILFMREFRKHENISRIKLVSGWVDKEGLDSLQIAKEELAEEVGMEAKKWELFHRNVSPGATIEHNLDYFIAKDLSELNHPIENPDGDVVEEIFWMGEEKFLEKLIKKEIEWNRDAIVILMAYKNKYD